MTIHIIESLQPLLVDLDKLPTHEKHLTIFDRTNFHISIKMDSIIIINEHDYGNLKHLLPITSTILIVNIDADQISVLKNVVKERNIDVPVFIIISMVDQFMISFIRSHGHSVYESDDSFHFDRWVDDDELWNAFSCIKLTVKMVKNGILTDKQWKGYAFKGLGPDGMEWSC